MKRETIRTIISRTVGTIALFLLFVLLLLSVSGSNYDRLTYAKMEILFLSAGLLALAGRIAIGPRTGCLFRAVLIGYALVTFLHTKMFGDG